MSGGYRAATDQEVDMSSTLDPNDEPRPGEVESLPEEEDISPGKVDEQLETDPEEARNFTDGYSPAEDPTVDEDTVDTDGPD